MQTQSISEGAGLADTLRLCALGRLAEAELQLAQAAEVGACDDVDLMREPGLEALRDRPQFRVIARRVRVRRYIAMLERPERDSFQMPDEVMRVLAFRAGEVVADVGAGSGYFTVRIARAVAPGGSVCAVDIHQEMLDHLAGRLAAEGITGVSLHLGATDDPRLPDGAFDTIMSVDVWHYLSDRAGYARRLRRALAPGGRIVIVDYVPRPFEVRPWGPLPEQQLERSAVDGDMQAAGMTLRAAHDFLPEQYIAEYVRADEARDPGPAEALNAAREDGR